MSTPQEYERLRRENEELKADLDRALREPFTFLKERMEELEAEVERLRGNECQCDLPF